MAANSTAAPRDRRLGDEPERLEDVLDELISFKEAARSLKPNRGDSPVHVSTLYRYHRKGVARRAPGHQGERIYLWGVDRPSGGMTTRKAVADFFAALTADRSGQPAPPAAQSSASRRKAEQIERSLDAIGV